MRKLKSVSILLLILACLALQGCSLISAKPAEPKLETHFWAEFVATIPLSEAILKPQTAKETDTVKSICFAYKEAPKAFFEEMKQIIVNRAGQQESKGILLITFYNAKTRIFYHHMLDFDQNTYAIVELVPVGAKVVGQVSVNYPLEYALQNFKDGNTEKPKLIIPLQVEDVESSSDKVQELLRRLSGGLFFIKD